MTFYIEYIFSLTFFLYIYIIRPSNLYYKMSNLLFALISILPFLFKLNHRNFSIYCGFLYSNLFNIHILCSTLHKTLKLRNLIFFHMVLFYPIQHEYTKQNIFYIPLPMFWHIFLKFLI